MLSFQEMAVMKILWAQSSPMSLSNIAQASEISSDAANEILRSLEKTGFIQHEHDGYLAIKTASEHVSDVIKQLVGDFYNGDPVAFLKEYIEIAGPDEIDAIKKHILMN